MNDILGNYIISYNLPYNFKEDIKVVGCYLQHADKILLLQVCPQKDEAGRWGVPAGKIDNYEIATLAALRELYEETKIALKEKQIQHFGTLYITKPYIKYVYYMFGANLINSYPVEISAEHQAYKWVSFSEALDMSLMFGAKEALKCFKKHQEIGVKQNA